jgi:hypothetical protein
VNAVSLIHQPTENHRGIKTSRISQNAGFFHNKEVIHSTFAVSAVILQFIDFSASGFSEPPRNPALSKNFS